MFDKSLITTNKNLLAFSAGVDSSALFFILLDMDILFDIAIVNYNLRDQAQKEVLYAKELAKKYDKKIFIKEYNQNKFSEKLARDFRYDFFDEIIKENNYDSLITAHQLNDKLEWFLMQLTKGAGVVELIGLNEIDKRKNYITYKPLLKISKGELLEYLNNKKIKYFIDETNEQNIYKRNYFRNEFSNKLISEFKSGIINSFEYINNDIKSLNHIEKEIILDELIVCVFKSDDINLILRYVDKKLKKYGIIISNATRNEIIRQKSIIISAKYSVDIVGKFVYIAPLSKNKMTKKFKEMCRINNIPKNIRAYLSEKNHNKTLDFINKLKIVISNI